jgi:hypothetical protein
MRRGSFVAPLLLIGIGVLFLARNLWPELPLLDYLARYWPFVLIAWGALRFIEVIVWSASGKPMPVTGISGGEWVLAIFLCLLGFSMHAARGLYSWLPRSGIEWGGLEVFGDSFEYPVTGEAPASNTPRVVIESFRGNARIVGGDGQTVKVTGRNTIRAMDQASADRSNGDTPLEVTGGGNEVVIRTHQDRLSGNSRISADLEIAVPRGATIVARGRDGDFDISNITGAVEIDSERASVRLEKITGEVRLDLRNSDIIRAVDLSGNLDLKGGGNDIDLERIAGQVTINGAYTGLVQFRALSKPVHWIGPRTEITAQALPGEMRMTLGDINGTGFTGPVRISSRSKDIWLADISGSLDVTLDRGDLTVEANSTPVPRINVRVDAGNVELALPPNAPFDLTAVTDRGEAVNSYGDPIREDFDNDGKGNRRRSTLRGSRPGGAAIDISVGRGELLVRRAGEILPGTAPATKPVIPPTQVEQ